MGMIEGESTLEDAVVVENLVAVAERFREHFRRLPKHKDEEIRKELAATERGFDQFVAGAKAVLVLLRTNDDELFVNIPTLCRPVFELASRLYWAWDDPDRWRQLWIYWAMEQVKQASGLADAPCQSREDREKWTECAQKYRDLIDTLDEDKTLRARPNGMPEILRQISIHQRERGDTTLLYPTGEPPRISPQLVYGLLYRSMSDHAHGHFTAVRSTRNNTIATGLASLQLASIALVASIACRVSLGNAELQCKREIGNGILSAAISDEDFDVARLKLVAYAEGSTSICDWSLRL